MTKTQKGKDNFVVRRKGTKSRSLRHCEACRLEYVNCFVCPRQAEAK